MKKGLLTLLAASLVFVGCQNYDDQFDDLNAQISALKSQVDGLSSISGQVSALSATISGLQAGVAAAQASADAANTSASAIDLSGLSASLATLQAEVDAVQASLATAATASAVAALQVELDALEADLDDLLVSNNVYATDITITDAASMASALALGNKVALMNATVTITDASTVSDTDLQTFIDRIKTMNGNFVYDSGSATGYAPTFDKMVSAKAITLTTAGDISFKALASATTVTINSTYESKITSVDFGALTSLTKFVDNTIPNAINLSSLTNLDLGSLTRYTTASTNNSATTSNTYLRLTTKKGATVDIASLDDVSTAGKQEDLYIHIDGASSVNFTNFADGQIELTNVDTATIDNFFGTIDIDSGVETLTVVDGVNFELAGATDLTTATLDFAYDYDPDLTTANAAIAAAGYSSTYAADIDDGDLSFADLETLTVTGELLDLYIDGTELVTLSIDATMHDLTISGATDLTTLTISSDSKIGDISLTGTTNLSVADFNHTTNLTDVDATAQKSVSFIVTGNTGLTKLHSTGDHVDTLTITGNTKLAELDFTGLKDDGSETSAKAGGVNVYNNSLTAASGTNTEDADTATATTGADGGSADAGSWDDGTSGMDTLKTYLTHIAATADSAAFVSFDKVSTFTDSEGSSDIVSLNVAGSTDGSTVTNATVLKLVANTADAAKGAIAEKAGFLITPSTGSNDYGTIQFFYAGTALFDTTVNGPGTALSLNGANKNNDVAALESAINVQRAANAGLILDAKRGGNSSHSATLREHGNGAAGAVIGERYITATAAAAGTTSTNYGLGTDDYVTMTLGTNSVTATAVSATLLASALYTAWDAKYGSSGSASATAIATMTSPTIGGEVDSQAIAFTMLQTDSGGYNVALSFKVTTGTSTATSGANIDWTIGSTNNTTDNSSVDSSIILTLESTDTTGATPLTAITTAITNSDSLTAYAMTTNYRTNTNGTGAGTYAMTSQNRTDVRAAEGSVTAGTSTAVSYNRVTWLG